jgi:hypothetical protein
MPGIEEGSRYRMISFKFTRFHVELTPDGTCFCIHAAMSKLTSVTAFSPRRKPGGMRISYGTLFEAVVENETERP